MKASEYEKIAKERAAKFKTTDELVKMGEAGVAREVLLEAEKAMKPDLEFQEKIEKENLYITYEDDEVIEPFGTVPFNGLLLTCNRAGNRPVETNKLKTFHKQNPFEKQWIIKRGRNADEDCKVGKQVLIDIDKYMQRNLAAPVILLPVGNQIREFLVVTDRDIKYIY